MGDLVALSPSPTKKAAAHAQGHSHAHASLNSVVLHPLNERQLAKAAAIWRAPKQHTVSLCALTEQFKEASLDEQLQSIELEAIPLKSTLAIQSNFTALPRHSSAEEKFFEIIARQLRENDATIVRARLSSLGITDTVLEPIAEALRANRFCQRLLLQTNAITDDGAELLCDALQTHPVLQSLWLGNNRITDVGMRHIALLCHSCASLVELNVANKWPSRIWAPRQYELHPHVTHMGAEMLARQIRRGSSLTSLTLADQRVRDEGAIALFEVLSVSNLRALNLSSNELTDRCCVALQSSLRANPLIQELMLANNEIADNGAAAIAVGIAQNTQLCTLDLSHNAIGHAGIRALAQSLARNTSLQNLLTIGNKGDDGRAESIAASRSMSIVPFNKSNKKQPREHGKSDSSEDRKAALERSLSSSSSGLVPDQRRRFDSFAELASTPFQRATSGDDVPNDIEQLGKKTRSKSFFPFSSSGGSSESLDETEKKNEDYEFARKVKKMTHAVTKKSAPLSIQDAIKTAVRIVEHCEKDFVAGAGVGGGGGGGGGIMRSQDDHRSDKPKKQVRLQLDNEHAETSRSHFKDQMHLLSLSTEGMSIDEYAELGAPSFDPFSPSKDWSDDPEHRTVSKASLPDEEMQKFFQPTPSNDDDSKERRRKLRLSKDLGKTLGVPNIRSRGVRPIRTSISSYSDSGQHALYLRVATEDDPPDARPYSLVKIGLERRAQREKLKNEHQTSQYKTYKQELLSLKPKEKPQSGAMTKVPQKFWRDWRLRIREKYPGGIDATSGCQSTQLEPINIPPPPTEIEKLQGAVDTFARYDRTDPNSPWNRYLAHKSNDRLSYQRHLGFKQREFTPAEVLMARRKENWLKKNHLTKLPHIGEEEQTNNGDKEELD